MACKTKLDRCILEDDLSEVLEAVMEADVLVMASPVYFGELSSQLKGFVDRTFSYLVPDFIVNPKKSRLAPGKTVIFILAQGNPDEQAFADIFPRYDYFYKGRGFDCSRLIRVCGVRDAGEVNGRKDVLTLAENTARQLFDGGACPQ
jgi:multimeric flavodoxin WrbA